MLTRNCLVQQKIQSLKDVLTRQRPPLWSKGHQDGPHNVLPWLCLRKKGTGGTSAESAPALQNSPKGNWRNLPLGSLSIQHGPVRAFAHMSPSQLPVLGGFGWSVLIGRSKEWGSGIGLQGGS